MIYSPKNILYWLINSNLVRYYESKNWLLYNIPNYFDPMPKPKRTETMKQYLDRIPAKYTYRYWRWESFNWGLKALNARLADLSHKKGLERKKLEELKIAIFELSTTYNQYFKEAGYRLLQEKYRK